MKQAEKRGGTRKNAGGPRKKNRLYYVRLPLVYEQEIKQILKEIKIRFEERLFEEKREGKNND